MEQEQKKEFTGVWIPKHIIEDENLSMSEMMIYAEIACFDICFKTNEKLGERYKLKANTISLIIKKLKEKGYVLEVGFDGRQRQLQANLSKPNQRQTMKKIKGRLLKKSKADYEKNQTIDNNIENNIDIISKDIQAEPETIKEEYGNTLVNEIIKTVKDFNGLNTLDDTTGKNRQYAYLLYKHKILPEFLKRQGYEPNHNEIIYSLKAILNNADNFHKKNITNIKYIYYNFGKLIQKKVSAIIDLDNL